MRYNHMGQDHDHHSCSCYDEYHKHSANPRESGLGNTVTTASVLHNTDISISSGLSGLLTGHLRWSRWVFQAWFEVCQLPLFLN